MFFCHTFWHLVLIVSTWKKASSQKYVDIKNAVIFRVTDRTEEADNSERDYKEAAIDHTRNRFRLVDCNGIFGHLCPNGLILLSHPCLDASCFIFCWKFPIKIYIPFPLKNYKVILPKTKQTFKSNLNGMHKVQPFTEVISVYLSLYIVPLLT